MAGMQLNLEIVGPNAGKTMLLGGKHQFVNGKYVLQGSHDQIEYALNYLAHFGAHPVGSQAHRDAQAQYKAALAEKERANGNQRAVNSGAGRGAAESVSSADGSAGRRLAEVSSVVGAEHVGAGRGDARVLPAGSGHADAGVSGDATQDGPGTSMSGLDRLRLVVSRLDPSNDDHWTNTGLPSLDAIQEAYPGVTRADVDEVAPGFTRQEALKAAGI